MSFESVEQKPGQLDSSTARNETSKAAKQSKNAIDPIPQVCVHGHTHVPELVYGPEARPASYVVCPGAPFRPRGGFPKCTGRMLVDDGRVLGVRIASLDGQTVFEAGEGA